MKSVVLALTENIGRRSIALGPVQFDSVISWNVPLKARLAALVFGLQAEVNPLDFRQLFINGSRIDISTPFDMLQP